ncbi:MAG: transporter substrate-binding domain-containing protein, partial [Variovorax sp.]
MPPAMLPRRLFSITLAGLLAAPAWAAPALWVSGDVPPYLTQGSDGPQGYAYELFQQVVRQAGVEAELRIYPWARALRMVEAREAHAALVMTRSPEREAGYRWLFPVGSFRFVVATRAADGPVPGDIGALRDRRIGALRGSVGRGMLAAAGARRVVDGRDFPDLFALLQRGVDHA